jgi:hypothetical protein
MRKVLLVMFWFAVVSAAFARQISGTIQRVTAQGIAIESAGAFTRSNTVRIIGLDGNPATWSSLKVGDWVQVTLDSSKRVVEVRVMEPVRERTEKSLLDLKPASVSGPSDHYDVKTTETIGGRTFTNASASDGWGGSGPFTQIVYRLPDHVDLFEAWLGNADSTNHDKGASIRFEIRGDDETLYTTKDFEPGSRGEHVSIPLAGRKSLTIIITRVNPARESWYGIGVIGDPLLITLPSGLPSLVSPTANEQVRAGTPLVWRSVDGATGYLLELQCIQVTNLQDADRDDLFLVRRLPAGTNVFSLADNLPKGKWRWRVSSLAKGRILGETKEWQGFTIK